MSEHTIEASTSILALRAFLDEREHQKLRGLNDYNLIGSLLKWHDEVRVHSGFLYSMLNPNGLHYQRDLFLRKFIDLLNIPGFDFDNAEVYKEKGHIDLFITDGKIKIIIELKIFAGDQEKQAARYIDQKFKESEEQHDLQYFIYLTPRREGLSTHSLSKELTVIDHYMQRGDLKICKFLNLHYSSHIVPWVDRCQKEVRNLTNLDYAFTQYREILDKVNRSHKSKLLEISSFLDKTSPDERVHRIALLTDILQNLPTADSLSQGAVKFEAKEVKEVRSLALNYVAKLLESAMTSFDEKLSAENIFVKLTKANTDGELGRKLYKTEDSKGFYSRRKGSKNRTGKGSFWILDPQTGEGVERWAIVMLYGSALLHVGLVRVKNLKDEDGQSTWSLVKPGKAEVQPEFLEDNSHFKFSIKSSPELCLYSTSIAIFKRTLWAPDKCAFELAKLFDETGPIPEIDQILNQMIGFASA